MVKYQCTIFKVQYSPSMTMYFIPTLVLDVGHIHGPQPRPRFLDEVRGPPPNTNVNVTLEVGNMHGHGLFNCAVPMRRRQ